MRSSSGNICGQVVPSHPYKLPLPPGARGLPFLGETLPFLRNPERFQRERVAKHGPIFLTHLLGYPTICVSSYEGCVFLLTKGLEQTTWAGGWPDSFHELLGHSLFVQDGAEHRTKRRLLQNAFTGPALASYVPRMEERVVEHLARWARAGSITCLPEMKRLTFEIASELLLGTTADADTRRLAALFRDLTNGFFAPPVRIAGTPFARAIAARTHLLDHLERVVRGRRATRANDALSQLVHGVDEDGQRLTVDELKNQALLLLFAGHDTTASFLTSLVRALCEHPEVLARAREEQRALGIQGPLTVADLDRMEYLTCVFKEVERLYPPVAGGFRGVAETFEFEGYTFPKGYRVIYRAADAHRDPSVFENPARFDPDRFGPARAEDKRRRFALMGFGAGPRVCLGMGFAKLEMKIVASHLLRYYRFTARPNQDVRDRLIPIRAPRSGYQVTFERLTS